MKQYTTLKNYIFAAAVSLGALSAASAQNTNVAVPNPADEAPAAGLLGSRYTEVGYKFVNVEGPDNAHGFVVAFNQPLAAGFDFVASYDWARVDFGSTDATVQDLEFGLKAFTNLSWGKPYILAAAGWEWQQVSTLRDDSFLGKVGVGVEIPAAPGFVITPFANFIRATGFNASEFELGAKVTYRVNNQWSVSARGQYEIVRHDADTTEYSLGVNYHF